jgi:hypothetical protein
MYIDETSFDDVAVEEIDLVPEDIEKSYFKIKVFIAKNKNQIKAIQYFSKDGSRYIINIQSLEPNIVMNDDAFIFNKSNYPEVFEVDLRE